MRLRRKHHMDVCQNCKEGNNKKGKWKRTWKRRYNKFEIIDDKKIPSKGFWHVFCEHKQRFYPWDGRKRCFTTIGICFACVRYDPDLPKGSKKCGTEDCKYIKMSGRIKNDMDKL